MLIECEATGIVQVRDSEVHFRGTRKKGCLGEILEQEKILATDGIWDKGKKSKR